MNLLTFESTFKKIPKNVNVVGYVSFTRHIKQTYRYQVTLGQVKRICNSTGYLIFSHLLFSRVMEDPAQG